MNNNIVVLSHHFPLFVGAFDHYCQQNTNLPLQKDLKTERFPYCSLNGLDFFCLCESIPLLKTSQVEVNINQGYKNLSLHYDTKIETTGMLVPFLHNWPKAGCMVFFMKFHKAVEA